MVPLERPARPASDSAGSMLVVEDEAAIVTPGQMRKSAFLTEVVAEVSRVADDELAAVGRSSRGCPYIQKWLTYYSRRTSRIIERAIHIYAPDSIRAREAREYVDAIGRRVRAGVRRWVATGEIGAVANADDLVSAEDKSDGPSR